MIMRARGGILLPLLPTSKREAAFEELDPRVAELGLMHLGERTQNPITVSVRKRTYLIFLSPRRSPTLTLTVAVNQRFFFCLWRGKRAHVVL
jgi:hypothetical protein